MIGLEKREVENQQNDLIRLTRLISEDKFQKPQVNVLQGFFECRLLFLLVIQSPQSALFKWCKYC